MKDNRPRFEINVSNIQHNNNYLKLNKNTRNFIIFWELKTKILSPNITF